jgi:hypothetical protein
MIRKLASVVRKAAGDDAKGIGELAWVVLQHKVISLGEGFPDRSPAQQHADEPRVDNHGGWVPCRDGHAGRGAGRPRFPVQFGFQGECWLLWEAGAGRGNEGSRGRLEG